MLALYKEMAERLPELRGGGGSVAVISPYKAQVSQVSFWWCWGWVGGGGEGDRLPVAARIFNPYRHECAHTRTSVCTRRTRCKLTLEKSITSHSCTQTCPSLSPSLALAACAACLLQVSLLRRLFEAALGEEGSRSVDINTIDGFQARILHKHVCSYACETAYRLLVCMCVSRAEAANLSAHLCVICLIVIRHCRGVKRTSSFFPPCAQLALFTAPLVLWQMSAASMSVSLVRAAL